MVTYWNKSSYLTELAGAGWKWLVSKLLGLSVSYPSVEVTERVVMHEFTHLQGIQIHVSILEEQTLSLIRSHPYPLKHSSPVDR